MGGDKDDNNNVEFQTETVDNEDIQMLQIYIFSFSCTLFKTKIRCLSLIELVKRTISGPSVLDAFYYPRFFRYEKLVVLKSYVKN